jgi:hypothetical protein
VLGFGDENDSQRKVKSDNSGMRWIRGIHVFLVYWKEFFYYFFESFIQPGIDGVKNGGKLKLRFNKVRVKCTDEQNGGKITIGIQSWGRNAIAPNIIFV